MNIRTTRFVITAASALLAFASASSALAGNKGQGGGQGQGHGRGGSQGAARGQSMGNQGSRGNMNARANARANGPNSNRARDEAGEGGPPFAKFKGLDTNRDGVVSSDEASANTDVSGDFDTYDSDADGNLSKREYARYKNSRARNNPTRDEDDDL